MTGRQTSFSVLPKKSKRTKTSLFLITINSNRADLTPPETAAWKQSIESIFSDVYPFISPSPQTNPIEYDTYQLAGSLVNIIKPEFIENIEARITYEYGDNNQNLHLHGYIEIIHTSRIRLNNSLLHQVIRESTGWNNYLNVIVSHSNKLNYLEYMRKYSLKQ